jgi:hypothetical protein
MSPPRSPRPLAPVIAAKVPKAAPNVAAKEPKAAPNVTAKEPKAASNFAAKQPKAAPHVAAKEPKAAPNIAAHEPKAAPNIAAKQFKAAPNVAAKEPQPSKPKRTPSPYMVFCKSERPKMGARSPTLTFGEVGRCRLNRRNLRRNRLDIMDISA